MTYYEMLCVLPGTLTEDEANRSLEQVKDTLGKHGVTEITTQAMGKSRLAYPIKHIRYGYFQLFYFNTEPNVVNEVRNKVVLSPDILRVMVQTTNQGAAAKSGRYTLNLEAETAPREEESAPVRPAFCGAAPVVHETALREETPVVEQPQPLKPTKPVSMEDIDKKLDEILQSDFNSV